MSYIKLGCIFLLSFFWQICHSQNVCDFSTKLHYINGVSNLASAGSLNSALEIQRLLKKNDAIKDEAVIPLENPSQGIALDVLTELIEQKIVEQGATFIDAQLSIMNAFQGRGSEDDTTRVKAKIAERLRNIANPPDTHTGAVTEKMIATVSGELRTGSKVILIAHSQGNMFALDVLNAITTRAPANVPSLKLVHVATPAATAQDNRYVTAHQDLVIGSLRLVQPVLPPNIDVPAAYENDLLGHGFLSVYLNPDLSAQAQVIALTKNAIDTAIKPVALDCTINPNPSLAAEISYLPSEFAGLRTAVENCRNPGSLTYDGIGAMSIGSYGAVIGSGCYDGLDFPADSHYYYSQSAPSRAFDYLLIQPRPRSNARQISFGIMADVSKLSTSISHPLSGTIGWVSSNGTSLTVNSLTRIKRMMASIENHQCVARLNGQLIGNAKITANSIVFSLQKNDGEIIVSLFTEEIGASSEHSFNEAYGMPPNGPYALSASVTRASSASQFQKIEILFEDKRSPSKFGVRLNLANPLGDPLHYACDS